MASKDHLYTLKMFFRATKSNQKAIKVLGFAVRRVVSAHTYWNDKPGVPGDIAGNSPYGAYGRPELGEVLRAEQLLKTLLVQVIHGREQLAGQEYVNIERSNADVFV